MKALEDKDRIDERAFFNLRACRLRSFSLRYSAGSELQQAIGARLLLIESSIRAIDDEIAEQKMAIVTENILATKVAFPES